MDLVQADKKRGLKTPVWDEYKAIINSTEEKDVRTPVIINYLPPSTNYVTTGPSGAD